MKNHVKKSHQHILALVVFLFAFSPLFAAGPPPPPGGVPIDGGASILLIAALGYGAKKMQDTNVEA